MNLTLRDRSPKVGRPGFPVRRQGADNVARPLRPELHRGRADGVSCPGLRKQDLSPDQKRGLSGGVPEPDKEFMGAGRGRELDLEIGRYAEFGREFPNDKPFGHDADKHMLAVDLFAHVLAEDGVPHLERKGAQ